MLLVKIINHSGNPLPQYQTSHSAGMDLHANLSEPILLSPGERKLIPTGLIIELPEGHEAQIRPRSGLALTDQANGACVFLVGDDCRVNPVKPQQCRDFPNLWNFPGAEQSCRAKPVEVSADEWRRRVKLATGRDVNPPA